MGPDGLTRRDRDLIRDVLARYHEVRRVTLFGSRAMGTFGRGSDIDLALEGRDLDARALTRIATELEDSDLPYKVDLLLRDEQLEPKLEAHIRRHGKPFGWKQSTWGEEISLEYGKSLKDYLESTSGFRVFGTNGPIGWTDKPIADGPGVILGRKGAYRGVHFSRDPFFVIDTAYYVVPKTELDMRWLYYAMIHYQLGQIDDGSPIPSTTRAAVYPREIVVPPFDEQRDISRALGALDDKIEQNRRTAQALEQLARAIFRAWFVDFEPVKAKAAGATAFPSMPQPVFDALPTRFVDSASGPVPEGWEVGKLGDVASQVREGVNPSEIDMTTPYIGLEHMPRRSITLTEWEHADKVSSGKSRFRAGQILFGKLRPYFHKVGAAPLDGVCSTDIVVLESEVPEWRAMVLCHASSDEFVAHATACSSGTKMPRTNWSDMASYPIVVPPRFVGLAFNEFMEPMLALLTAGIFESRKLTDLRDYLLPKLLSGQVQVNDAARSMREVG